MLIVYLTLGFTLVQKTWCSSQHVHQFHMSDNDIYSSSFSNDIDVKTRVRRDIDSTCLTQEQTFLSDITSGKVRLEEKDVFESDNNTGMALAWAGNHGTMIVVTSQEMMGIAMAASKIYRTEDYGKMFKDITKTLSNEPIFIRKHSGIFRHPLDPMKVYLLSDTKTGTILFTTEDGGLTFHKSTLTFNMDSDIQFNQRNTDMLLASSSSLFQAKNLKLKPKHKLKTVYVTRDNGKSWNRIADSVQTFKWASRSEGDTEQTIYATIDSANTQPFFATFFEVKYDLKKSTDLGSTWTIIMEDVIAFGLQDKFLYVAIPESRMSRDRIMKVSTNGGKRWDKTYLPSMSGERFFSVLDMAEGLVFMHVDNPGDTGHGTLYTSSGNGMLYSESLQKHLYPNYGDTTDFYRVQSMRGVYLASQMRDDNSIHTVISYNLGGTWHAVPAPPGVPCKDTKKECSLQIHGAYSRDRGIISELPLSVPSAKGLILVHGHIADALQTTSPDVFITSDGGYTWRKALDGPHHYHIADSGSLLVAVPADTKTPKVIKFSTDEGRCWHSYNYIDANSNETIMFTGLLTEPGSKSLTVSIWGYRSETKKWITFIIDFHTVLKNQCDLKKDYVNWTPHETSNEKGNIKGCLLGRKETFQSVKKDSWCFNGFDHVVPTDGNFCTCVKDDYECDYGYYRPDGQDNCVRQPGFNAPEVDICKQGREEEIITKGYRKLPGDKCVGGFVPTGELIDLHKKCAASNNDEINVAQISPADSGKKHNASALIAVFVVVALIITVMAGFFIYKYVILKRHNVTYRYSLLNQNDAVSYDDELENALTKAGLYHDSDDEELNSAPVRKANGSASNGVSHIPKEQRPSRSQQVRNDVQSYHDDSDVDMLN